MLHQSTSRGRSAYSSCVVESMESRTLLSVSPIILGAAGKDLATSVATDSAGNIYVAGSFQGTVDADSGAAVHSLTSSGVRSVFVAKYSAAGKYVWAKRLGGLTAESDHDGILGLAGALRWIRPGRSM